MSKARLVIRYEISDLFDLLSGEPVFPFFNFPIATCNWLHKGRGSPVEFIYCHMACLYLDDLYMFNIVVSVQAGGIGVAGTTMPILLFGWEKYTNIPLRQLI